MFETMFNAQTQTQTAQAGHRIRRKHYHLGVRLDDAMRADLMDAARADRRTPSDLARIMIADALAARAVRAAASASAGIIGGNPA